MYPRRIALIACVPLLIALAGCTSSNPPTYLEEKYDQEFVADASEGSIQVFHPADDEDLQFSVDTEDGLSDDYAARKMGKYFTTFIATALGRGGVSAAIRTTVPWPEGLSFNADWRIQDYIEEVKPEAIELDLVYPEAISERQVKDLLTTVVESLKVKLVVRANTSTAEDLNPCYDYLVVSAIVTDAEIAEKCQSKAAWQDEFDVG
jgi:hypothetical protein